MKAVIFYVASDFNHSTHDHTPIAVGDKTFYVRGELVETKGDISDALDEADPMEGEVVLNSVDF